MIRYCDKYQIDLKEPEDIASFYGLADKLVDEKRKAPQLLFADIDTELKEKERFVTE